MEGDPSLDPYFAIFDSATSRTETNWASISDVRAAVDLLMELFWLSRSQARLAAICLWGARAAAEYAVPQLRDLIPRVASSTEHQRLAAVALASLSSGPEPMSWVKSANPVLRRVAAEFIDAVVDGEVAPDLRRLLGDADGYVREAAIANLVSEPPANTEALLEQLSNDGRPGWMCLSCRTVNAPGVRSCRAEECHRGGPDPTATARKLLSEIRQEAS
jgi:hypothetical protein